MNIGHACKLLDEEMNTFVLQSLKPEEIREEIETAFKNQAVTKKVRDNAVVVAGETLSLIQMDKTIEKIFVELCEGANVVLACRVSPK